MTRKIVNQVVLLLICLGSFHVSYSQDSYSDSDLISRFRPGVMWFFTGINPAQAEKAHKYDRLMIGIHSNQFTGDSLKPYGKKTGASIGFFTQLAADIPLANRNRMSLGIGLGYKLTSIRMNGILNRDFASQSTNYVAFNNSSTTITKSLFRVNELYVPLELRFRTKNWEHVKFHIGGRIGWQFLAKTRYKSVDPSINLNETYIASGFFDLNPLQLAATARIGIRNWAIYGTYQFLPYFKSAASTQLNGFELGIALSLF